MPKPNKNIVPAVDQAAQLLIHLAKQSGSGKTITEICREVGIHNSRGYSILNTLVGYDIITKDQDSKRYRLGMGLIGLARNVLDNNDIRKTSEPYLKKLARETNSTALLGLISHGKVFVTSKQEGDNTIGVTIRLGNVFHITHGAHGKAIFAFMKESEKKKIIEKGELYFQGNDKNADLKRLGPELETCREKGFAVDAGETNSGINALSAPLFDHNGGVNGCVILIGTFKNDKFDIFGKKLTKISRVISEQSGVDPENIKI